MYNPGDIVDIICCECGAFITKLKTESESGYEMESIYDSTVWNDNWAASYYDCNKCGAEECGEIKC